MLTQLTLLLALALFALLGFADGQLVYFGGRGGLEGRGDVVVFVEVLERGRGQFGCGYCYSVGKYIGVMEMRVLVRRKVGEREEGERERERTISPSNNTFSPRTRNIPRWISVYRSLTKMRSMVSCRTRFAAGGLVSQLFCWNAYSSSVYLPSGGGACSRRQRKTHRTGPSSSAHR